MREAEKQLALSNVSRAIGLAESLEHPIMPLPNGARAVASEIVVLLGSVRELLVRLAASPDPDSVSLWEQLRTATAIVVLLAGAAEEPPPKPGPAQVPDWSQIARRYGWHSPADLAQMVLRVHGRERDVIADALDAALAGDAEA